ncbi:MAG: transglutaminase-like domain-containing protein [Candidatus Latescibacter sp.]|nr:transglutaminase-like domain-containing protein [Candidatus Latescibacter sp.]
MKKCFAILVAVSAAFLTVQNSSADRAADAYMKAVEQGDVSAAYKAQSYLEPPYCYDLNRWHGVKFVKAVNGRVVLPSFPFLYQDMTHLKVRKLYVRAGLEEMIKGSKTDLDLIVRISDWANKQWGHTQPLPYPTWDAHEILDRVEKGDAFWCTFKADLFVQACNAAGLTARILGINPFNEAAHTVAEVYNNDLRKWMLVDAWINCWFEKDGVPLSALEVHKARGKLDGVYMHFGANGRGTEYWDVKAGKAGALKYVNARIPASEDPNKGLLNMYDDYRIVMRNDQTVHPQSKEVIMVDGFIVPYNSRGGEWWGPQLHWVDEFTPLQITCANSGEVSDFQWPLNEVKVDLMKTSVPGAPCVLKATSATNTPNFDRYLLEVDGKTVPIDGDVYVWKLNKGLNSLKIASVNAVGRKGFPSEFVIEYDPTAADHSRHVDVVLKNPGFEDAAPSKDKTVLKPANWGTIFSNPFQCEEFALDDKVKHSGKYSLRAVPKKDPQTGVEYAFIVKSDNFQVNAATDVIYSIWLRAAADNTPVDIALLESEYKGQGTYHQRVMVGREWRKYDLPCRLHNWINQVYVGFKVYTGTVWGDDAQIVEVKR